MSDRCEARSIVAISYDKQRLIDLIESNRVEQYVDDDRWRKSFKKGSVLEWYNPFSHSGDYVEFTTFWDVGGIQEEWVYEEKLRDIEDRFYVLK